MAGKVSVTKKELEEKARNILERAREAGVEQSYMFLTTFGRYREHIAHLAALEREIKKAGTMVTKEYVKGRQNIYVNPAINAYNSTAAAADKTAALLLKYVEAMAEVGGGGAGDSGGDAFDKF